MADAPLDFSLDPVENSRSLVLDAARRVDALHGHLGDGPDDIDVRYGDMLRTFAEDQADFGPHPDVYPVPVPGSSDTDAAALLRTNSLNSEYTFWWMRIPLVLFARKDWTFTRLEVRIDFNSDEPDGRLRPKAHDIFPNRRFDTVLHAGADATVKLGGNAHFDVGPPDFSLSAIVPGLPVTLEAGLGASGEIGAKVDVGVGVKYKMTAARVNHTSEGLPQVFWRLDGAELFQESPPNLIVILQVPKAAAPVQMLGVMQAYRRFNLFPAGLQSIIRQLPQALRAYFTQGAPVSAHTRYDLGPLGSA